jgi:Na+-driven multidrug efflux pump
LIADQCKVRHLILPRSNEYTAVFNYIENTINIERLAQRRFYDLIDVVALCLCEIYCVILSNYQKFWRLLKCHSAVNIMYLKKSNIILPESSPNYMDFESLKIIKNVFANVARGTTAALVIILLPPFLTRILLPDAYSAWLLILQLSAYVAFLDFGIQTAVGRFVAHTNELRDFKQRDSIISTSLAILTGSGVLAMLGIIALAWQLPQLFRGMPTELHQEARFSLLLVGGSLAFSLPFSVFSGIFIGIQRYDVPAWIIGISKLCGGALGYIAVPLNMGYTWDNTA